MCPRWRGDCEKLLSPSRSRSELVAVHADFPDPWWRNKHKQRRVLNEQVLQDIERSLIPGGQLHFWTDVLDYYEHICAQLMDTTKLAGPRYVPQREAEHSMDYTTHFERRGEPTVNPSIAPSSSSQISRLGGDRRAAFVQSLD